MEQDKELDGMSIENEHYQSWLKDNMQELLYLYSCSERNQVFRHFCYSHYNLRCDNIIKDLED